MKKNKLNINQILKEPTIRKGLARENHYYFMHIYLADHVKYQTAKFQQEMFRITENEKTRMAVIVAFRGSAKTTIMTLSYPLWSIIGKMQKKFVVILCQTHNQAKLHLTNIKNELKSNELLRSELGPFEAKDEEWSSGSIVIPKYGARITVASTEQSIRGFKHRSYRPDLIICDDIEDLNSVKTKESRDKTYNWLTGEVIPAGDNKTKIILVGNLLHEDSVLMRLKESMEEKKLDGIFKFYPLVNDKGRRLWPGKFPNKKSINQEKRKTGNEVSWQREYMLRIVPDTNQVVRKEWLRHYDELPDEREGSQLETTAIGVDLAISQKEGSDFTAIVSAKVYIKGDKVNFYILPTIVNKRLDFPETIKTIQQLPNLVNDGYPLDVYVEKVGYQESLVHQLNDLGIAATGVTVGSEDKKSRLNRTTSVIQNGTVLFPTYGAEELIQQLIGFEVEKHDDLVDAFTLLILELIKRYTNDPGSYSCSNKTDEDFEEEISALSEKSFREFEEGRCEEW